MTTKTFDTRQQGCYILSNMEKVEKVKAILSALAKDAFYGQLTIKFEAGKIVHCKKEETVKV